jgi:hypothetical protein
MHIKCFIIIVIIFILVSSYCIADEKIGGQGGAFLQIPIGARPAGLGNAFTAVADDINADYFNPAGLCQIQNDMLGGMYNFMSMDRAHYQAVLIKQIKGNGLALSVNRFGVSEIDGRDSEGYPTEKFDDSELALKLAYSRKLLPFFGIGGGAKYIIQSLGDAKGSGFAFDAGVLFLLFQSENSFIKSFRVGGSFNNIGGKMTWNTESENEDEIPINMRVGSAIDFNLGVLNWLATVDASQTEDNLKLHFGVETWLIKELCIRAGLDGENVNFGASLRMGKFQFDYAFCPDFLNEGATSKLGIQLRL